MVKVVQFIFSLVMIKRQIVVIMVSRFIFLSASSNEARASRNHFFLSPDFHKIGRSMMNISLFTEVKQQWAMLVQG